MDNSTGMRLISWNINSVRLRERQLARLVRTYEPDVVCLQETKVRNELFPSGIVRNLGYAHQAVDGEKSYNGVAVLSRLPLTKKRTKRWAGQSDCRHLTVTLPDGTEVHNVYVPAGGDLPDPERNEKFAHKLRFLREMARWFRRRRVGSNRLVLAGDLNVAPLPTDVWSHEKLRRVVTHTPVEVEALAALAASRDWVDAVRHFVPLEKKIFTWWSYRAPDWRRVNKGRRLDHIWVTPPLVERLRSASVVQRARGWKLPSDHAPVMIDLGPEEG